MGLKAMLNKRARRRIRQQLKIKEQQNMEVRDSLAMDRTKLANERTLMAYLRTAMAMVLAGLTFIKLFDDPIYIAIGISFIPVGVAAGFFGYYRFEKKKREISFHMRPYTPTSPVLAKVTAQEQAEENKKSKV